MKWFHGTTFMAVFGSVVPRLWLYLVPRYREIAVLWYCRTMPYKRVRSYWCTCAVCGHEWLAVMVPSRCAGKKKCRAWGNVAEADELVEPDVKAVKCPRCDGRLLHDPPNCWYCKPCKKQFHDREVRHE